MACEPRAIGHPTACPAVARTGAANAAQDAVASSSRKEECPRSLPAARGSGLPLEKALASDEAGHAAARAVQSSRRRGDRCREQVQSEGCRISSASVPVPHERLHEAPISPCIGAKGSSDGCNPRSGAGRRLRRWAVRMRQHDLQLDPFEAESRCNGNVLKNGEPAAVESPSIHRANPGGVDPADEIARGRLAGLQPSHWIRGPAWGRSRQPTHLGRSRRRSHREFSTHLDGFAHAHRMGRKEAEI